MSVSLCPDSFSVKTMCVQLCSSLKKREGSGPSPAVKSTHTKASSCLRRKQTTIIKFSSERKLQV